MKRLLSASLVLCGIFATAQTVVIKKVELILDKVVVTYDLDDNNPNNEYLLNLYTSKDNFVVPLKKVTGDIGAEIKPGVGKRVEWSIIEEYGGYKGKISLEVRGRVYVPAARLQNFDVNKTYRRGKSYDISWKPGNNNPINLELYKGGQRISGDMNVPNNGGHHYFFPTHAKPGKDYRLKLTDPKNPDDVIYSPFFKVGPKIPLWMKATPVVLVGVLVAVLAGDKPKDENTTTTGGEIPLPDTP